MESRRFIRWLWLALLLINLMMAGLAAFTLRSSWHTYVESSQISTQNLALMLEREIVSLIASVDLSLLSMSDEYAKKTSRMALPEENWNEQLRRQHAILPLLSDLGAANAEGLVVWGQIANDATRTNVADHDYFLTQRNQPNTGLFISSPILSQETRQWSLVLSRRLNAADGQFTGIVTATVSLKLLYEHFGALKLGQNGSVAWRDDKLRLILRHPILPDGVQTGPTRLSDDFRTALARDATQGSYRAGNTSIDQVRRYHSYRFNPQYAFYINVGLSEEEHFAAWHDTLRWTCGLVVLFLLVTVAMAVWLGHGWRLTQRVMLRQSETETALRHALSQAKQLTDALDHTPSYIYIKNAQSQYVYGNRHTLELFGCSAEALIGSDDSRFFPPATVSSVKEVDTRVLKQGTATHAEIEVAPNTPEWRVYWELKQPLRDHNGDIWGLCGISTDITDRKRIENALTLSEETYRALFDNMLNGFALHEILVDDAGQPRDYRFLEINQAFTHMTGLQAANVVGRTVLEIMPRTEPFWIETYGRVALNRQATRFQNYSQETGKFFEVFAYSPRERQFATIFEDITERKQAEATILREKHIQETLARLAKHFLASREVAIEEIAQHVLDASLVVTDSPCGYVNEVDPQTGLAVNRAITTTFPLCAEFIQPMPSPEETGSQLWALDTRRPVLSNTPWEHPDFIGAPNEAQPIRRLLSVPVINEKHRVAQIVVINGRRDYTPDDTVALERIASLLAITLERVKLERQLRHAGKLEAIGTLSAGIAHDFNNILGIILGYTEVALHTVSPQERIHGFLQEIFTAGVRAKALVDQLLTFSRKSESPRQPVLLSVLVKEVIKFFRASVPSSIDIESRIEADDLVVNGNADQLHQLLMNLCTNARQAIPAEQGTIRISLERVHLSSEEPGIPLAAGDYARLQVLDTGMGIPPEILDHIFDPFFTTKEIGKGTGLGLSVVHGIVTNHGGAILVTSTPGTGSLFRVYLPVLSQGEKRELSAPAAVVRRTGVGTLLVVDDEPQLLSIYQELLSSLGYEVVTETRAQAALRTFATNPERFCALITDYAMPHMTGIEMAHRVKAIRPDMPILLCTGLGSDAFHTADRDAAIDIVLHKPVPIGHFSEVLARVLNTHQTSHRTGQTRATPAQPKPVAR
ncbi:MAG: PAS domain-containing protein [Magnetococcales bacterium]|nr:PAS domain-containing protein [Magnetococcales bacterium]